MSRHTLKSLPEMMKLPFYQENRHATMLALPVGLAFPLVGYLVMHRVGPVGGQGAWGEEGPVAWACRAVALACLTVSAPKVVDWLSIMFGAKRRDDGTFPGSLQRVCAIAGAAAIELTVLVVPDPYISAYMLALSAVMNAFSVATSTVADHKAIHAARKAEEEVVPMGDSLNLSAYAASPQQIARMLGKAPSKPKVKRNRGPARVAQVEPRKRRKAVLAA